MKTINFENLQIRCSSLSKIMTKPALNELSVGAKTYVEELVDAQFYEYDASVSTKQMQKGTVQEPISIILYNSVFFTNYEKVDEPKESDFIKTASCDIDTGEKIIDIKSSFTKKTFPKTKAKAKKQAIKAGYEWQLLGYMMLYKRKKAEIAYCLVDTPENLCEYEDASLHVMDNLEPEFCVTRVEFEFDEVKASQIIERVKLCQKYAVEYYNEILNDHKY